jgi:hypothetical protein
MSYAIAALGAVLVMLAPSPPQPTAPVAVQVVEANGSGCPAATSLIHPNWQESRISFYYPPDYLAGVGPAMRPTDFRRQCRLVLTIVPPAGYTFAVAEVTHRGSALLQPGASGTWSAVHHFDGDPAPEPVRHTFAGPFDDIWVRTENAAPEALVWAPCDNVRPLVVTSRLTVAAGTSDPTTNSWLAMHDIDISPSEYHIAWRAC